GLSSIFPAENSEQLLLRYTPEQQIRILAFYREFGEGSFNLSEYAVKDIFSFRTVEQLRWLLSQGYPTPDDVLAAEVMTDAELEDLASAGNFKAAAFYLDRKAAATDPASLGSASLSDLPEIQFREKLENQLLATGSPFAAYVIARRAASENQDGM